MRAPPAHACGARVYYPDMWLLQIVSNRAGSFTANLREVADGTYVPDDPPDGVGARVSSHPSREAGLEAVAAEALKELGRPSQPAPAGLRPILRSHNAAPKIFHSCVRDSNDQVRSSCGVTTKGPFTENLSEVTCGRCLRVIEAARRRKPAESPAGPPDPGPIGS